MKHLAIVILHYTGLAITANCLRSLRQATPSAFKLSVFIVNNNPAENLTSLSQHYPAYTFIASPQNLGYAAGNNLGIRAALAAKADYLLILNNDTILARDFFTKLNLTLAGLTSDSWAILAPKIYFAPGYEYHKTRYTQKELGKVIWYAGGLIDWANVYASHRGVDQVDSKAWTEIEETDFATGCCFLIKATVFNRVGLFSEAYYLYLEDLELSQRVKAAGYQILFCPQLRLWHLNAGSSSVGGNLQDYFITRNRLLFGLSYAPFRTKLALIKESGKLLFTGRPWQKQAIKDYYSHHLGKGSWSHA